MSQANTTKKISHKNNWSIKAVDNQNNTLILDYDIKDRDEALKLAKFYKSKGYSSVYISKILFTAY